MRSKKDKIITAVLAWFLGGFGGHRFYLGQTGKGVMHLLFFWTFIPAIIGFIDFIAFLTMSQDRFDQVYNPDHYYGHLRERRGGEENINVADEIYKLDQLFQKGVITFEEFERRKAMLLNR